MGKGAMCAAEEDVEGRRSGENAYRGNCLALEHDGF